eukprot:15327923-Ditylum_brightwellii.AAC.1
MLGTFNDDTFNNESPRISSTPSHTRKHPIQTHPKMCVEEFKGDAKVQNKDSIYDIHSKGSSKEYNRSEKCDLSLLTKRVQSSLKSKEPHFQDPSKPSTRHKIVAKNKHLKRSKRKQEL